MKVNKKDFEQMNLSDIYYLISKNTGIKESDVRKVFMSYEDLWDYAQVKKQIIPFGKIGYFTFDYHARKKAGTLQRTWVEDGSGEITKTGQPKRKPAFKKLEKDVPSYCRSVFKVYGSKQDFVKKATEEMM